MYSKKINGILVITFVPQDSSADDFCWLIEGVLDESTQVILDFINVAPEWPLGRLFIAIKYIGEKYNVKMAAINLSEIVVRQIHSFGLYAFDGLIEAMHFLTKKDLKKCQCGAWLPFALTTVSWDEKQRWHQVHVCPSCGLLHTRDGQPVIYNDSQVFLRQNQIVCK